MKRIFLKIALVLLCASFIMTTNVFADEQAVESIMTISPMSQKIILVPGETYVGSVNISNPASATRDLTYSAKIGSFTQESDTKDSKGEVGSENRTEYNMIVDWISLDKATGTILPNGIETLSFKITVPKDAPAGGQYATILVKNDDKSAPKTSGNSAQIGSVVEIASIIYAEVAGETRKTGEITENNFPSFLTTGKLEATSMVKNTGNVHTDAEYMLQVWPMFSDEEICTNEEKTETSLIMPETERYHVQTCDLPAVGIFRAKQVVKIFGEESTLEKTIVVCPIWLMVLILIIIIALIVAVVIIIRKHKTTKPAKTTAE